jgi:hypothetical protein
MPIIREENIMGGESIYLAHEEDLADIPPSHAHLVGPEERAVLRDPLGYLERLAERAEPPQFRDWLLQLAAAEAYQLELHTSDTCFDDALFCLSRPGGITESLRLGVCREGPELPPPLVPVYALINGTNQFGYACSGGLCPRPQGPISQTGVWFGEDNQIDPDSCVPFYETRSGTLLCYQGTDRAVWYHGGSGTLTDAGPLSDGVAALFAEFIQGNMLEPAYD